MLSGQRAGSGHEIALVGTAAVALLAGSSWQPAELWHWPERWRWRSSRSSPCGLNSEPICFCPPIPSSSGSPVAILVLDPRLNELLLMLLLRGGSIALRLLVGRTVRPELNTIDLPSFLAVTSSVFPLLLRYNRGSPLTSDVLCT